MKLKPKCKMESNKISFVHSIFKDVDKSFLGLGWRKSH